MRALIPSALHFVVLWIAVSTVFAADPLRIEILSNDPKRISGGDVLVRIQVPPEISLDSVAITRNGHSVKDVFRADKDSHALVGVVDGLRVGHNILSAGAANAQAAEIAIINHPIHGPVFSGPHEEPFMCGSAEFQLPNGRMLGEPLDANCSTETVVTYVYRSTDERKVKPLTNLKQLPADVAVTVTTTGERVPYVVRVETGTINRSIYQFAVLHNPAKEEEPAPWTPPEAWNKRLLYSFGGGCTNGWFRQGSTLPSLIQDNIVGKGYVEAVATLNVFGTNCQDLTAAETMMMVKERIIEALGVPLFTFGRGGSGGSYQQIQIADNYPGLLDGIIPSATFPEVLETTQFLVDIQLLHRYFNRVGNELSDAQKQAISGVGTLATIGGTQAGARRISPTAFCPKELPVELRYHPVNHPTGARCDIFDHTVNVYGRDPETGFARRTVDNQGVQYGLVALQQKAITVDQFLDLNEFIGGHDNDGNLVAKRSTGDPMAIRAAYQTGRITNGGLGLGKVPILDVRVYMDLREKGDVHLKYHSFAFRERLRRANGSVANTVMVVAPDGGGQPSKVQAWSIQKMDEWLTKLYLHGVSPVTMAQIEAAKPADLVDACLTEEGDRIVETQSSTSGKCHQLYPNFPSPRMLAGGPVTNDVLKCALRPIEWNEYGVPFTAARKKRLEKIFPDGVCDWSHPGIEQQAPIGTWLRF